MGRAVLALIESFYLKTGNGRPPYPLETMLRIHLLQTGPPSAIR